MFTKQSLGLMGLTASLLLGGALHGADTARTTTKTTAAPATTTKVRTTAYQPTTATVPATREVRQASAASVELGAAKPCPTETFTFAAPQAAACAPCAKSSRNAWCRFWDWVTYRPVTNLYSCCEPTSCTPPLYAYYLDHCPPPVRQPNCGHPGAMHVAAPKVVKEEVVEKESFSLLPRFFFSRSTERKASKPVEATSEVQQIRHAEVVTAKKAPAELKQPEAEMLRSGTESSKWRGVPVRPLESGRR